MNMMTNLSFEQALQNALLCVGIENEDFDCSFRQFEDGLYHFLGRTLWMKYEFYVEAVTGEVLGIDTEPCLDCDERGLCEPSKEALSAVA